MARLLIVSVLVAAVATIASAQMQGPFGLGGPRGPMRPPFGGPAFGGPAGPGGFGFGFDGPMGPNGDLPSLQQISQQAMSMASEFLNNFFGAFNQQRPGQFNPNMDPSQMFQNFQQMMPDLNQNPSELMNNMMNNDQTDQSAQPSSNIPTSNTITSPTNNTN